MMKKLIFILMTIVFYSCNKSQTTESNTIENNTKVKDTSTQIQNIIKTKPITYEQIKDMSVEDVIKEYPPTSEETFILGKDKGFISEFRTGLLNIFKEDDIKNKDIKIKEITWGINDKQNLTIWYNEKDSTWIPVDHLVWDKEMEF